MQGGGKLVRNDAAVSGRTPHARAPLGMTAGLDHSRAEFPVDNALSS